MSNKLPFFVALLNNDEIVLPLLNFNTKTEYIFLDKARISLSVYHNKVPLGSLAIYNIYGVQ